MPWCLVLCLNEHISLSLSVGISRVRVSEGRKGRNAAQEDQGSSSLQHRVLDRSCTEKGLMSDSAL